MTSAQTILDLTAALKRERAIVRGMKRWLRAERDFLPPHFDCDSWQATQRDVLCNALDELDRLSETRKK